MFSIVEHVDDVILWLNLVQMCNACLHVINSFLPKLCSCGSCALLYSHARECKHHNMYMFSKCAPKLEYMYNVCVVLTRHVCGVVVVKQGTKQYEAYRIYLLYKQTCSQTASIPRLTSVTVKVSWLDH